MQERRAALGLQLLLLTLLPAAFAQTPLIAPTLPELHSAADALSRRTLEAEAVQQALRRTHNHLAERLAAGSVGCEESDFGAHAARTQPLGEALRDRVQSARAQRDRLDALQSAPTITPALTDGDRAGIAALSERVASLERNYRELSAWQRTHLQRWLSRCQPPLTAGAGLPSPLPKARGESRAMVAILGVGDGVVCPGARPAAGVHLLESGKGCYSEGGCDCESASLLPGAVLGLAQSGSAE